MLGEVAVDGGLQVDQRAEYAAAQAAPGHGGEEGFDRVEPGAGGRCVVERPALVPGEPSAHLRVFVGGIVVEDHVDQLASRDRRLDRVEEADELLMAVPLHAAAEHGPVEHVEGGEQGGGAMPDIIVRHRPGLAGLERQARLGAIEGLDLALFVDRQHDRMAWRGQIEADDVRELGDELGITAALEAAQPVRLQLVRGPDPLHRSQGQPGSLGHHATGPVGRLARRLAAGQSHHTLHHGVRRGRLARLSGPVAQQPVDAGLGEALLPAPDRRAADLSAAGNLRHVQPLGRGEDDPCPRHMLLRPVTVGQDRRQTLAILRRDYGTNQMGHGQTIAQPRQRMNLPNASVH